MAQKTIDGMRTSRISERQLRRFKLQRRLAEIISQRSIRERRKRGWNLSQVPGIACSTLHKLEEGDIVPQFDTIVMLAAAYGLTLAEFTHGCDIG